MDLLATTFAFATAALLLAGAASDVRSAKIPNWLVLAGLVAAALAAVFGGGPAALGFALLAGLVAFAIGFSGFALGAIGGGDAKFLVVGAVLVGLPHLMPFLLATAVLGGILVMGTVLWQRKGIEATVMTRDLAKSMVTLGRKGYRGRLGEEGRLVVPYGVAIAAGALVVQFTSFAEWLLG
jgi:prepilin peptidase CpaA